LERVDPPQRTLDEFVLPLETLSHLLLMTSIIEELLDEDNFDDDCSDDDGKNHDLIS
jgi:hypothetical protein